METIVLYNRPLAWFNPFAELSFFEPVISYNNLVSETTNESPTGYSFELILPEFRKKDLSIRVENGLLKVEATRKSDDSKWFNRNKNSYENHYIREFSLTDDMDAENIKAKFKDGQLTIDIPKKREYVNFREIPVDGEFSLTEVETIKESSPQSLFNNLRLKIERIFKKVA